MSDEIGRDSEERLGGGEPLAQRQRQRLHFCWIVAVAVAAMERSATVVDQPLLETVEEKLGIYSRCKIYGDVFLT